jgi:hypothetical protein
MKIFEKVYDGNSIMDASEDVGEALCEEYNDAMTFVPVDEYGFSKGTFTITIEWKDAKSES